MHQVADILSSIVFLAMLTVLVTNKNTATILSALGGFFTGSLKTAEQG